jgi:hypothetical protein
MSVGVVERDFRNAPEVVMSTASPLNEYLVLSRGQWDADLPADRIQTAIDDFYAWYERNVADGRFKPGHRLTRESKLVSRSQVVDGPFTEAKEIIGGYWFIVAGSLEDAARIAGENPVVACGLMFEVRPLELKRASAYEAANETPSK